MKLDEFEARLNDVEFVDLIGPVDRVLITTAAKELGVVFPTSYIAFVERFGCGGVGTESFIGLGGPDYLNVKTMTQLLRGRHPDSFSETLIPIRSDGYGNYDCIDLDSASEAKPVIEWLHDGGRGKQIADSFDEWLDGIMDIVFECQ